MASAVNLYVGHSFRECRPAFRERAAELTGADPRLLDLEIRVPLPTGTAELRGNVGIGLRLGDWRDDQ